MRPDLRSYDWILVSSSAGKDSQAMLDFVVAECDAAGVSRDRIVVVHANLGRVEWGGCPELAAEHAAHYGLQFLVCHRTQGDLLDHVESRGKWPSSDNRYCTSDHKRGQVRRVVTALCRAFTGHASRPGAFVLPADFRRPARVGSGPVRVLSCMGLRAEESPKRAKLLPFERSSESATLVVDDWLPVHGWTLAQVWDRIRAAGTRHHHAYDLGMPRLSCCFCIFAPMPALEIAAVNNLDLLREYARVERVTGHQFTQRVNLNELLARAEGGEIKPGTVEAASWIG